MKNEREELTNLVGQRMSQLRNKSERSEAVHSQRTGKETLKALLADTPLPEQQSVTTVKFKPQIILYLRSEVNPAVRNFTKYPNEIHNLMAETLNVYETVAYIWIWRISWGYGNNYCRFGQRDILKKTSISSLRTVQRVIKGLREKRFIIAALDKDGERESTNRGSLYRICSPREILYGRVEEGISLEDIPTEGVVCEAIPSEAMLENALNIRDRKGTAREAIPRDAAASEAIPQIGDSLAAREAIPSEATPIAISVNPVTDTIYEESEQYRQKGYTLNDGSLKEDNLKDSLSPDPVMLFYTGIGQQKISKQKRESGYSILQELQKEGFSPKDLQYAVEWTLMPGNTKEKVRDFSIIPHTIGQALAARDADEEAAENARNEEAGARAAEEDQRRLESEIRDLRAQLNEDELAELRKQAEEEIRNSGKYKEQFINEPLIVVKENEILKRES